LDGLFVKKSRSGRGKRENGGSLDFTGGIADEKFRKNEIRKLIKKINRTNYIN